VAPLVAGVVVAAVASWILPQVNERFKGKRDHLSSAVNALIAELEKLQALAAIYWGTSQTVAVRKGDVLGVREAEIEYRLQQISSLLTAIAPDLWPEDTQSGVAQLFTPLAALVSDADFGTQFRKAKPDKGREIAAAAAAITYAVHQQRRSYFAEGAIPKLCRALVRLGKALHRWWNAQFT